MYIIDKYKPRMFINGKEIEGGVEKITIKLNIGLPPELKTKSYPVCVPVDPPSCTLKVSPEMESFLLKLLAETKTEIKLYYIVRIPWYTRLLRWILRPLR